MSYFVPKEYVKEEPKDSFSKQMNYRFFLRSRVLPYMLPMLATLLIITQIVLPLVSFTTQDTTSKPVSYSALGVATGFQEFKFDELGNNNVLGSSIYNSDVQENTPDFFYITVPKLNINNALVETNAKTLNPEEALGHYKGSALPGEIGNTFIYGHSVIPFFYNPKNYKTIFSKLNKLEPGDIIYINYNNQELTYKVEGKRDLKPKDVYPLAEIKPAYLNESTMVLMTCSPAGTKLKRLLVDTVQVL